MKHSLAKRFGLVVTAMTLALLPLGGKAAPRMVLGEYHNATW